MHSSLTIENEVRGEIARLFAFQGKNLTREQESMFVQEIMRSSFPIGAILAGLRSLMLDEMGKITLGGIFHAIRSNVEPEPLEACPACVNGCIVMRDDQGRDFALACRCSAGIGKAQTMELARWNGEEVMISHNRALRIA